MADRTIGEMGVVMRAMMPSPRVPRALVQGTALMMTTAVLAVFAVGTGHAQVADTLAPDRAAVGEVLDALHQAAAVADFDRYFGLYASEFVFLGTDATERWDRSAMMEYARERFAQGQGWAYSLVERHVVIGPGRQTAWFDERLDNASLGETRGSGVLVVENGTWKVAQYNLTIPIPNDLAGEVVDRIREQPE